MLKCIFVFCFAFVFLSNIKAQAPIQYSSSEILQQIKKLEVFGSVLYVAAHPDDENTKLLAYLANEKKYRTGYLSLTRGDGGQNLIGDEQGIELGLIRTQELLAARRKDGAQQFFTRAYDFGFCKNPDEALKIWNHDIVLADMVWVIRKFKPDVIITRFPTTGEGGHGHHTASAILAGEAFEAAADSTKFTEQLNYVKTWKAKRLLWNTFNFGGNNTTKENQFKIDCGGFNSLFGKSYGEIAADSRSSHKSQGFGVPAQRGKSMEYFTLIKGDNFNNDILEGIDSSKYTTAAATEYFAMVNDVVKKYDYSNPASSIKKLIALHNASYEMPFVNDEKRNDIQNIIKNCAGLFFEAIASNQLNAISDSIKVKFSLINRSNANVRDVEIKWMDAVYKMNNIVANELNELSTTSKIDQRTTSTQPYFLEYAKKVGSYNANQTDIDLPEKVNELAVFNITIDGNLFEFKVSVKYKYTDPVKGEIYQPIQMINSAFLNVSPNLILFSNNLNNEKKKVVFHVQSNSDIDTKAKLYLNSNTNSTLGYDSLIQIKKSKSINIESTIDGNKFAKNSTQTLFADFIGSNKFTSVNGSLKKISYDHIPDIFYNYQDNIKVLKLDLKTDGKKAGYIVGAGDKVPQALEQMGYSVTLLSEKDFTNQNLKQFDVIVTGIRAYNIHEWLNNVYDTLMHYVNGGGTLLMQYNTNNSLGPLKAKMSPSSFTISKNRITDENAAVKFLIPTHPFLNYPNKITAKDFEGWIQERSIYNAEAVDTAFQKILAMHDPNENDQDGSLIAADYGKGRIVYTGLVFFRELPAAVPGAYRLFANLIAKRK
jgi:LmbE family N-acetylglucosaminyl deacetylase